MENENETKMDGVDPPTPDTLTDDQPAPDATAPDIADGAAIAESEKTHVQETPRQDTPVADGITLEPDRTDAQMAPKEVSPEKNGRGGKAPNADKAEEKVKSKETSKSPQKGKIIDLASVKATADSESKTVKATTAKGVTAPHTQEQTTAPGQPPQQREAPRPNGTEQIVYLNITELRPFKNHPFAIREDAEMKALVESVKDNGVNQPALVRPMEAGGYEIIAGHRRQKASELAGYGELPCIIRKMTDDEAVLAMTDDNLRQRSEILPSEKAQSLKMQFEAVKHQGARFNGVASGDIGKRSIEIVGERNNMNGRQVQRYIRLTELVPDLIKAVDEKKMGFTSAVEISFINRKNQNLIAVSIEGQQSSPSLSQAQRMRELDQRKQLNGDVIDGILCEQKKEVDKVIISGEELNKYFGKDKTPREMKDQIIKLLDEWSGKVKALNVPEKKNPDRV